MMNPIYLDLLRGLHLLCVVLGMGAAMYFDLRCLHKIARPLSENDVNELHRIHALVRIVGLGLWISGVTLIWLRTNFDLASFTPKLWCKVLVVIGLTANSLVLGFFVIPVFARYKGVRLIDVPVRLLLPMTICAGFSVTCWLLALALGSSRVLKAASWDLLLPFMLSGTVICMSSVLLMTFASRYLLRRSGGSGQLT
jgi:hypothetical protein